METPLPLKLKIKTLSDHVIELSNVDISVATIKEIKDILSTRESIPPESLVLILDGTPLADSVQLATLAFSLATDHLYLLYFEPSAILTDPIETAKDWDQKNRCKFFKGIWALTCRDFSLAAELLTEALATFAETRFMPFKDLVKYAAIAGAIVFDRPTLQKKIIKAPEVLEVIEQIPHLEAYLNSLYNCQYQDFFVALGSMEEMFKNDWLLAPHYRFIVKEMRVRAYGQILQSYRSLTLDSMAQAFGVTVDFIDRELSRFIAAGRLNCVIDQVGGVVETNTPDIKNAQYQAAIKQGDSLLNRIQKLGSVISY